MRIPRVFHGCFWRRRKLAFKKQRGNHCIECNTYYWTHRGWDRCWMEHAIARQQQQEQARFESLYSTFGTSQAEQAAGWLEASSTVTWRGVSGNDTSQLSTVRIIDEE